MELKKASEILTITRNENPDDLDNDTWDATMLAFEALKRCQLARKETSFVGPGLLPGETPPDKEQ